MKGRPVVIRTFDIGADKQLPGWNVPTGRNPALGMRGIRRHLRVAQEELQVQFRAILKAGGDSPVGIMVPMVTTPSDVRKARRLLDKAKADLHKRKIPIGSDIRFGAMIETPAAALHIADILAEVDFVSLGTNDLLQYLMAADRDNEHVLEYNDATDPAFLWLLEYIIQKAIKMERQYDVSICGEIASNPSHVARLLRMGYRSFSVLPVMADEIGDAVKKTDVTGTTPS
jgi:phosphoenolpyruvate-protein kinase (PTS system EI component)